MKDHRLIDERSLAFDRLTAAKIKADPRLVDQACQTVNRWLETCSPASRPTLLEWKAILDEPLDHLFAILSATDERATRLRQSSPFAGIFTATERTAILTEFQKRDSRAA
jgi:hypothetical protein